MSKLPDMIDLDYQWAVVSGLGLLFFKAPSGRELPTESGEGEGVRLGACSVGARLWLTPHTKIDAQADIFTFIPLEKA
ncbi:MAG: hypothetical protein IJY24_06090 [Clostridia bacterium]|nr:hypothetical protein [Clostridia bacterium]